MKLFLVTLRREHVRRFTGDVVTHWVATIGDPILRATGRSLGSVERALRKKLAATANGRDVAHDASFRFQLEDTPEETRELLFLAAATAEAVETAVAASRRATTDALRALILGTPSMSLRDAARLLGVKKSSAHRLVAEPRVIDQESLSRLRQFQRDDALAKRRAAGRAPAAPGSEQARYRALTDGRMERAREISRRKPRRTKKPRARRPRSLAAKLQKRVLANASTARPEPAIPIIHAKEA